MAIKPVLHRIIVKQEKLEDRDETFKKAKEVGIIIHQDERKREQAAVDTGTVVAIGPTAFRDFNVDEPPIQVGDYVTYAKYGGKTITDPETQEEFVALNDEDIISVLTK